jgi:D-lactate dehydrogenase (cytochrome)
MSIAATPARFQTAIDRLAKLFPGRVERGEAIRHQHANTLTWFASEAPDAVVWPETTAEVVAITAIAREFKMPIVPFGSGTSLEGHVNAPMGGVSVDFSRMNNILAVNDRDLDCVVEPGVTRKQLNEHLRDSGLFFSVDPGAEEASLGGMASTRASGTNTVRYGSMRDNVLSLVAVMADGTVIRTGGRARKSAAGYDLTRLLIGSEGTLGLITELRLRLYGVPETILAAVCPFQTINGACNSAIEAIQSGLGLARIELLDGVQIHAVNVHSKLALEEAPTLFLEFHGSSASARYEVEHFGEIARANGALRFDWAEGHEERRRLWRARHDAFWAVRTAWPGRTVLATDICVPISRLAECVSETAEDIRAHGLTAPIVGHVGDGNFHTIPVFDASDPRQLSAVRAFLDRLVARAIAMDGTCTGEHGIGQGKMNALEQELGPGLEVMQSIKRALDPLNILNPGKIFRLTG